MNMFWLVESVPDFLFRRHWAVLAVEAGLGVVSVVLPCIRQPTLEKSSRCRQMIVGFLFRNFHSCLRIFVRHYWLSARKDRFFQVKTLRSSS